MRITLQQTASRDDLGALRCCICRCTFHLGPATCWAIDESNVLWGEVCPSCIERGPEHIEFVLKHHAWWARIIAEQETSAAEEGITDCPTLDEILVAESYYERPMFETGAEYMAALERGEID
jgi:hypothetical protein